MDRNRKRAKAVATDLLYGAPLCPKTEVVDGDYNDLANAVLVMITAGINEKDGGAPDRNDIRQRQISRGVSHIDSARRAKPQIRQRRRHGFEPRHAARSFGRKEFAALAKEVA